MAEGGLSPSEVGREIAGHAQAEGGRRDWVIAVVEASLLAVVAVLAAWSGYASAKWATESRLDLARASTARTEAASEELVATTTRNFDASTFTAWFVADVAGNKEKMALAERRFRPGFLVAFNAWLATNPDTNTSAPPGPTYMPEYQQPDADRAALLNKKADTFYARGSQDGTRGDDYVRITVYLATVLFLIAIAGHFQIRGVRIGLIVVGSAVLVFSVVQLLGLPLPPA